MMGVVTICNASDTLKATALANCISVRRCQLHRGARLGADAIHAARQIAAHLRVRPPAERSPGTHRGTAAWARAAPRALQRRGIIQLVHQSDAHCSVRKSMSSSLLWQAHCSFQQQHNRSLLERRWPSGTSSVPKPNVHGHKRKGDPRHSAILALPAATHTTSVLSEAHVVAREDGAGRCLSLALVQTLEKVPSAAGRGRLALPGSKGSPISLHALAALAQLRLKVVGLAVDVRLQAA